MRTLAMLSLLVAACGRPTLVSPGLCPAPPRTIAPTNPICPGQDNLYGACTELRNGFAVPFTRETDGGCCLLCGGGASFEDGCTYGDRSYCVHDCSKCSGAPPATPIYSPIMNLAAGNTAGCPANGSTPIADVGICQSVGTISAICSYDGVTGIKNSGGACCVVCSAPAPSMCTPNVLVNGRVVTATDLYCVVDCSKC